MTPLYHPRPERWPTWRFSLRSLFVLLTIFGIWLGVQAKWVRDRREAIEWVKARGGTVEEADRAFRLNTPPGGWFFRVPSAPWSLRLFGIDPVFFISLPKLNGEQSDAKARELAQFFPEALVQLQ